MERYHRLQSELTQMPEIVGINDRHIKGVETGFVTFSSNHNVYQLGEQQKSKDSSRLTWCDHRCQVL